jgi:hypothetical protein
MDTITGWLNRWEVMVPMIIAFLALIGLMIFLRMKPRDE